MSTFAYENKCITAIVAGAIITAIYAHWKQQDTPDDEKNRERAKTFAAAAAAIFTLLHVTDTNTDVPVMDEIMVGDPDF